MSNPERLQALPQVPREEVGPLFAEPWQAFELAVKLSEQGHFTWKEWADALANELKAATSRKEPDDGSHYYDHWLAALEHLSRNWRHKTLNANKLHEIATLPFSGFSTQHQFLAQVTEP